MSEIENMIQVAVERLNHAIWLYKPVEVFGLFSGGHDSTSACKIASLANKFSGVVHINTGIGVEGTREFVRCTSKAQGWKLLEYNAWENTNAKGEPDPYRYDDLVMKFGFPGPYGHGMMYSRLKERSILRLTRDFNCFSRGKHKRRIMLVSGCRSAESTRRMATTKEVQKDGARIWCAPIHDWNKLQTTQLLEHFNIPRNPIVDLIHKSGECLCGAFAKPGELEELSLWPETRPAYERIKALEEKVKAKGFTWGWEGKPPTKPKQCGVKPEDQHLCQSCNRDNL